MIRSGLSKLLNGLLTGIGLGAGLVVVFVIADPILGDKGWPPEAGVKVIEHRELPNEHGITIVGKVENSGEKSWGFVEVSLKAYDQDGNFLNEVSNHLDGRLRPGDIRDFRLSMGRQDRPLPPVSRYEVGIVDGIEAD